MYAASACLTQIPYAPIIYLLGAVLQQWGARMGHSNECKQFRWLWLSMQATALHHCFYIIVCLGAGTVWRGASQGERGEAGSVQVGFASKLRLLGARYHCYWACTLVIVFIHMAQGMDLFCIYLFHGERLKILLHRPSCVYVTLAAWTGV